MKTLPGGWLLVAAVIFGILVPLPADAQKVTLPEEMVKARPELSVAKQQLTMYTEHARRLLQTYRMALANESIPIDENLVQPARNTYALIRAANESMGLMKQYMKYPDPVFELARKRLLEAQNLTRTPVDRYTWSMQREAYLSLSVRDVERALQLKEQALVILP